MTVTKEDALKQLNDMLQEAYEYAALHGINAAIFYDLDEKGENFNAAMTGGTYAMIGYCHSMYKNLPATAKKTLMGLVAPKSKKKSELVESGEDGEIHIHVHLGDLRR